MDDKTKAELLAEITRVAKLRFGIFAAADLAKVAALDGIPQDEVDEALALGLGYERIVEE